MNTLDVRALFLRVCEDLERRLKSNDDYELLKSSGLLRQLMLDDSPLIHQVNKSYRKNIEFEISDFPPPDSGNRRGKILIWSIADGLDPRTSPPIWGRKKVNLEKFLHTVVLRSSGVDYTIKDVILLEANVMGGIHAGSPRSEHEKEFAKVGEMFSINGLAGSLRQLTAISRVTLVALRPLREAIIAKHSSAQP